MNQGVQEVHTLCLYGQGREGGRRGGEGEGGWEGGREGGKEKEKERIEKARRRSIVLAHKESQGGMVHGNCGYVSPQAAG